ncbi:hypothetical protein SH528x_002472 [Novipirellula sp. SH528]|uniref:hypothetical protein n=1 Tax=Novipirellula sp. SH528 TaxID=3454466 RepID=UPI003FA0C611
MAIAASPLASLDHSRIVYRRLAVITLYVMAVFWGAMQMLTSNNGLLGMLCAMGFATSATMWFWIDCHMRSRPLPWSLQFVFFLTWPLASLIYLMASRGMRGFGYWLLHAVGLCVTVVLSSLFVMMLLVLLGINVVA